MIIYHGGAGGGYASAPEVFMPEPTLLLTYYDYQKRVDKRAKRIFRKRKDPSLEVTFEHDNGNVFHVNRVQALFLDSGSFSLRTAAGNSPGWEFYGTQDFIGYMDAYSAFVHRYKHGIDDYANTDAIKLVDGHITSSPEVSWKNLKYLEKNGLAPLPVVHYRPDSRHWKTDFGWLEHYLKKGYKHIALGGFVGRMATDGARNWLDKAFDIICDTPDRTPRVKVHGFGITLFSIMVRYPWYSVDSTAWIKLGSYGRLLLPRLGPHGFELLKPPLMVAASTTVTGKRNMSNLRGARREAFELWLKTIGVPMGAYVKPTLHVRKSKTAELPAILEDGVLTNYTWRQRAIIRYYDKVTEALPEYPWPWRPTARRRTFFTFEGMQ